MKRIITNVLLTLSVLAVSAQESGVQQYGALANMFKELSTIIHSGISTTRGNYGRGQITTQTSVHLGSEEFCSKDVCGVSAPTFLTDTTMIHLTNEKNKEICYQIIGIIRHHLDSLSALPSVEESYHFEVHRQGIDTIRYSICLHSGKGQQSFTDSQQRHFYVDAPGTETVTFNYETQLKPCGRHTKGFGNLTYSRTESVPGYDKTQSFDWEQYVQALRPILEQRGITKRTFHWAQDKKYGDTDTEYSFGFTIVQSDGSKNNAGETDGLIYFIPAEQLDFAKTVLHDINFATQDYIYNHPQQTHQYSFDTRFTPIPADRREQQQQMLRVWNVEGDLHHHFVFVCSDPLGYYFMLCDTKGSLWVPRESLRLKSFINGKKVYFRGMKPKKSN